MSRGRTVNSVFPSDKCLTRRSPRTFGSSARIHQHPDKKRLIQVADTHVLFEEVYKAFVFHGSGADGSTGRIVLLGDAGRSSTGRVVLTPAGLPNAPLKQR